MFWRPDTAIDELRARDGWREFHRAAGKRGLYFDLTAKEGRRYKNTVFTLKRSSRKDFYQAIFVAEGEGKTPLDAFETAYRATGRTDDELDRLVAVIRGKARPPSVEIVKPVENDDDFDALFDEGVEDVSAADEFDALFG